MQTGRHHPVFSTIANWYLLATVYGALAAILCLLSQRTPGPLWSVLVAVLTLAATIIYQARSARVCWLSPGEMIAGRASDEGGRKTWVNPWCANRWALNLVLFIAMMISGNSFDGVSSGHIYPLGQIAVKIVVLIVLWLAIIATGLGSSVGLVILVIYFAGLGGLLMLSPLLIGQAPAELRFVGVLSLGLAAFSFVVSVVYHRLRENRAPGTDPLLVEKGPPPLDPRATV